jgi:hypothetical protein
MIPIGTAVPSRYPPIITWVLIATNCIVFLFQQSLSPAELNELICPHSGTLRGRLRRRR